MLIYDHLLKNIQDIRRLKKCLNMKTNHILFYFNYSIANQTLFIFSNMYLCVIVSFL